MSRDFSHGVTFVFWVRFGKTEPVLVIHFTVLRLPYLLTLIHRGTLMTSRVSWGVPWLQTRNHSY